MISSEKNDFPLHSDKESCLALCCRLYRDGAYAECYRLLACLEKEMPETASLYVNIALCHMQAQEWQAALSALEKALSLVKRQCAAASAFTPDSTYKQLSARQAENDSYLCPMPSELPPVLPDYVKQTILRLMIDVCVKLELWDRVTLLGEPLRAKGYGNVYKALKLIQDRGKS